jgi:uncharacterized FlaG/YvyC family protein
MDSNAISPLSPQAAIRQLTNDVAGAFDQAARQATAVQTREAVPAVGEGQAAPRPADDSRALQEAFQRLGDVAASLDRPINFAMVSDAPDSAVRVQDGETGKTLREMSQAEIQEISARVNRFQDTAGLFVDEKA